MNLTQLNADLQTIQDAGQMPEGYGYSPETRDRATLYSMFDWGFFPSEKGLRSYILSLGAELYPKVWYKFYRDAEFDGLAAYPRALAIIHAYAETIRNTQ